MIRRPSDYRSAFSLMELLIVITLIGILAALVASATMRIVGVQEGKTTETNLLKLQSLLDQHWKAVIAKANSDVTLPDAALKLAGKYEPVPTPNWEKRARVIHVKLSLRQNFPVTVAEIAANPPPGYPWSEVFLPAKTPGLLSKVDMSSALVLLALKQARGGVSMDADSILNSMDLLTTAHPDVKIIADGWGKPIVFSRWPISDLELNGKGPELAPPWRDPQDPTGLLSDDWIFTPQYTTFAGFCHPTSFPPPPVTPKKQMSYRLEPVLMSGGPDKEHGLVIQGPATGSKEFASLKPDNQNPDPVKAVYYLDNIYTYRLRMGGSGN